MNPIFQLGSRKTLEVEDIYDTTPEDQAENLANTLYK